MSHRERSASSDDANAPSENQESKHSILHRLFEGDRRWTLTGGFLAVGVTAFGAWATGRASGFEAQALLMGMLPTTRFLCSGVMTASATTLALMLTLLSVSANAGSTLKKTHYERVQHIALLSAIAFSLATAVLLLLNIPVEHADNVTTGWYKVLYYGFLSASAVVGGLLVVIVLMLYNTVRYMAAVIGPGDPEEIEFVETEEEEEEPEHEEPEHEEPEEES